MSRGELERSVLALLRKQALSGSTREVALDEPLGELGLDSLGLLSFLVALEKVHDVEMPEDLWTANPRLTIANLVDLVEAAGPGAVGASDPEEPRAPAGADARVDALRAHRPLQRLVRGGMRRFKRLLRPVYRFEGRVFLERPLDAGPLPSSPTALELVLREASKDEASSIDVPWGPSRANRDRWVRSGNVCLTAWHAGALVGIDWIAATGEDEAVTGLRLRVRPGTCFGLGLDEDPAFEGRGVGLSLLAYSLAESRRRGFTRQVTMVATHNVRMLTASLQLMGFQVFGESRTISIFRRPRTRWRIHGTAGRGQEVLL